MDLNNFFLEAAQHFCLKCIVPITLQNDNYDSAFVAGSGSLFEFNEKIFFVTAHHIFEKYDHNLLGIPVDTQDNIIQVIINNKGEHTPLKQIGVETFKDCPMVFEKKGDIAAIQLKNKNMIDRLKKQYHFFGYNHIALPAGKTNIIVLGYPEASMNKIKQFMSFRPLWLQTMLIGTPNDAEDVGPWDCFLGYNRIETLNGKKEIEPIKLHGVSGGPILQFKPHGNRSNVWSFESQVKFIGIEKSFKHRNYIRGLITVQYFIEMLKQKQAGLSKIAEKIKNQISS